MNFLRIGFLCFLAFSITGNSLAAKPREIPAFTGMTEQNPVKLTTPVSKAHPPSVLRGISGDSCERRNDSGRRDDSRHASEKIDICFQHLPIQQGFEWLAEYQHQNMILSPKMTGQLSLKLKQVSWDDAFHAILQTHELATLKIDHIFYVAPIQEINEHVQSEIAAQDIGPFKIQRIPLFHTDAKDLNKTLKAQDTHLLSPKGFLLVDERTNTLLVHDYDARIKTIQSIIKHLDLPLPQILIEARIVNLDDDSEKELGIRFGLSGGHHLSGTLEGANALADGKKPADIPLSQRLNVDLAALNPRAGHIGLALAKLSRDTLLDLELSALETQGKAEILSTPRLLTANHQTANIEAGEEIPYQESVSEGVTTTAFKKAVLSLQVTPEIIAGHQILLHLKVNQDKRSNKEILGVPAIDTRQISTNVLLKDGETLVLGGIYEHTQTQGEERIPFLSDLPFLGVLFKHKKTVNNRRELLIFVTPNLMTPV